VYCYCYILQYSNGALLAQAHLAASCPIIGPYCRTSDFPTVPGTVPGTSTVPAMSEGTDTGTRYSTWYQVLVLVLGPYYGDYYGQ